MPSYCCAVGCTNLRGRANVSFFRFPKDKRQRRAWVARVRRAKWKVSEHSRIFSAHFIGGKYFFECLLHSQYKESILGILEILTMHQQFFLTIRCPSQHQVALKGLLIVQQEEITSVVSKYLQDLYTIHVFVPICR